MLFKAPQPLSGGAKRRFVGARRVWRCAPFVGSDFTTFYFLLLQDQVEPICRLQSLITNRPRQCTPPNGSPRYLRGFRALKPRSRASVHSMGTV